MLTEKASILVSKEISDYIVPLSTEEFSRLEQNIIAEGCLEPLSVWEKDNDVCLLVDGHNRYKICLKNDIPFKIRKLKFKNIDDAKVWMVNNQMGRRNLTSDQLSYYRGLKYLTLKKKRGGYDKVQARGRTKSSTSGSLAEKFSVSESTVKRDAKFAEGLNIIGKGNPKLKSKILVGLSKVKRADVQTLANARNPGKLVIKNEADLYNKAKNIRDEALDEIESRLEQVEKQRVERAQKVLAEAEPVFLDREDRLRKIKGLIVASINRAITKKDIGAIEELRRLIDRLTDELTD